MAMKARDLKQDLAHTHGDADIMVEVAGRKLVSVDYAYSHNVLNKKDEVDRRCLVFKLVNQSEPTGKKA